MYTAGCPLADFELASSTIVIMNIPKVSIDWNLNLGKCVVYNVGVPEGTCRLAICLELT